jgi:hypothetical protein
MRHGAVRDRGLRRLDHRLRGSPAKTEWLMALPRW